MKKRPTDNKSQSSAESKRNDKDMSTAAQRRRVVTYLRSAPQTTYSLRARGISHPAARVRELIARGYLISSDPVTAYDSDGYEHRGVALYTLLSGPETVNTATSTGTGGAMVEAA